MTLYLMTVGLAWAMTDYGMTIGLTTVQGIQWRGRHYTVRPNQIGLIGRGIKKTNKDQKKTNKDQKKNK